MPGTAHRRKTAYHRSFVLGGSHTIGEDGELRAMTEDERDDIAATCSRYASELCTIVAKGAGVALGIAAAATALILAGDLGRRGGGTRKAKKSKRKARATRSRKH